VAGGGSKLWNFEVGGVFEVAEVLVLVLDEKQEPARSEAIVVLV
jgi:hypothetical protein